MRRVSSHLNSPARADGRLERALNSGPPDDMAPASLHGSIMDALRTSPASQPMVAGGRAALRLLAALALALPLVFVWSAVRSRRPDVRAPLGTAVAALQVGQEAPQIAAAVALRPLADEMGRLNQDLDETTRFVLASIP